MQCPSCAEKVSASARYCSACGRALSAPAARYESPARYTPPALAARMRAAVPRLEGERKQITVLFADITGSTEMVAGLDPEEARRVLDPVLELMIQAVHRYDGTVNQVLGDGIMALFGAPVAHEDHAVRACYAAAHMQEAMRLGGASAAPRAGVRLRVGLNSGEVVVRSIASDLRLDYTAVGETTHLAARMEQSARPGAILLGEATARLAEAFVDVAPVTLESLKGLRGPVTAYELVALRPLRSRLEAHAARGLSPFVGRAAEMATLEDALADAAQGRGAMLAVIAEPGSGKSRLLWEFSVVARRAGASWLDAMPALYGRGVPFAPLVALIQSWLGVPDEPSPDDVRDRVAAVVPDDARARLLAPVQALLGVPVDDPGWLALGPEERRALTLDVFRALLQRARPSAPLCIVVEDLHWIDPETEWVLDSTLDDVRAAPVLVLVTFRPEYRPPWAGRDGYRELVLAPLAADPAEALLRSLLGPDPELSPLAKHVLARADGNPFFLEEIVRHLADTGVLRGAAGAYHPAVPLEPLAVPGTIHALLADRIDRLRAADKHVLQIASVLGTEVPLMLLEAVADVEPTAVRQSVESLVARGHLVGARATTESAYEFRHALTQEVALAGLLRERRAQLDGRVVDVLEAMDPDRRSAQLDRLARHALRGQRWEQAVRYCRESGERAVERSALRAGVEYFEQALAALAELPQSRERQAEGIDLLMELRHALGPLGESRRLQETLADAEQRAVALGDQRRIGLVAAFLANFFTVRRVDFPRAIECGERAVAAGESVADVTVEVLGRAFLSLAHYGQGDYGRAAALAAATVERLREHDVEPLGMAVRPTVYARTVLAWSLAEQGAFERGIAIAREGLAIAAETRHVRGLVFAYHGLGVVHLRRGDAREAVTALESARALTEEHDLDAVLVELAGALASAYVLAGRAADATALLEHALARAIALRHRVGHWLRTGGLGEAYLAAGAHDDALPLARMAVDIARGVGARGLEAWAWHLAAEAERHHDVAAAEGALAAAVALAEPLGMTPLVARCALARGRLAALRGAHDVARATLTDARAQLARLDMPRWASEADRALADLEKNGRWQ